MSRVYIAKISNSIAVFMAMTPIRRAIPGLLEISFGRRIIFYDIHQYSHRNVSIHLREGLNAVPEHTVTLPASIKSNIPS